MEKADYTLDKDAEELFQKLQRIDTSCSKDRLAEGLGSLKSAKTNGGRCWLS